MSELFQSFGISTKLEFDPTLERLNLLLDGIADDACVRPQLLLFYFAGHAENRTGQNVLLFADASRDSPECDITLSSLLSRLVKLGNTETQFVILLDTCRDNASWPLGDISEVPSRRQFFIAFACAPGRHAAEDASSEHGRFTKYLLEELLPFVPLHDVMQRVTQKVVRKSSNLQRPWVNNCCTGPVVLQKRVINLPPRNIHFVGRSEESDKLMETLSKPEAPAAIGVYGQAGIGKSQLACQLLHHDSFKVCPVVWWVNSETTESAGESLHMLAIHLGVARIATDRKQALQAVAAQLIDMGRRGAGISSKVSLPWVIVFDNAGAAPMLLPDECLQAGAVLFTSRDVRSIPRWAQRLELPPLQRAASVALLQSISRVDHDPSGADRLAKLLGDFPLALAQAAAYIHDTGNAISFDIYSNNFQDSVLEYSANSGPLQESTGYAHTMSSLWKLTKGSLLRRCPLAVQLMYFMSLLHPDGIEHTLLQAFVRLPAQTICIPCCAWLPGSFVSEPSSFELDKALSALRAYSLISEVVNLKFHVHRLTQRIVREDLRSHSGHTNLCKRTLQVLLSTRHFEWFPADDELPYIHHLRALEMASIGLQMPPNLLCQVKLHLSGHLVQQGVDLEVPKRLLFGELKNWPPASLHAAACHFGIGYALSREQEDSAKTREHLAVAIRIGRAHKLGGDLVAVSAAELVMEHASDQLCEQAEALIEDVERGTSTNDAWVANNCHYALAIYWSGKSDFAKADKHFQSAVESARHIKCPGGPRALARSLDDRADLHRQYSNFEDARKFEEEAIRVMREHFTDHDRSMAPKLMTLGLIFAEQGDWAHALKLFNEVIESCRKRGDDNSRRVANALHLSGRAMRHLKQNKDAMSNIETAAQLYGKICGDSHFMVGQCFVETCWCHVQLHQLKPARKAINCAQEILVPLQHDSPKEYAYYLEAQAELLMAEGDVEQSKKSLEDALKVAQKLYDPAHQFVQALSQKILSCSA